MEKGGRERAQWRRVYCRRGESKVWWREGHTHSHTHTERTRQKLKGRPDELEPRPLAQARSARSRLRCIQRPGRARPAHTAGREKERAEAAERAGGESAGGCQRHLRPSSPAVRPLSAEKPRGGRRRPCALSAPRAPPAWGVQGAAQRRRGRKKKAKPPARPPAMPNQQKMQFFTTFAGVASQCSVARPASRLPRGLSFPPSPAPQPWQSTSCRPSRPPSASVRGAARGCAGARERACPPHVGKRQGATAKEAKALSLSLSRSLLLSLAFCSPLPLQSRCRSRRRPRVCRRLCCPRALQPASVSLACAPSLCPPH